MVSSKIELKRALELSEDNIEYGNFYDAIKTHASLRSYTYGLKKFMQYLTDKKQISNIEDYSTLAKFDGGKSTDLIKSYIKILKKTVKPTSVNAYVAPIFLFFDMNRTAIFKKEINRVKDKNDLEQSGHTPVTDIEIQNMIRICNHPKDIALVLFLSSTGMRPGGINDPVLCMKHLEYMADPTNPTNIEYCYAVKIYDGSRQHYWGFLTPETTKALDKYFHWRKTIRHEVFTDDTSIFASVSLRSNFNNMTGYSLYRLLDKIYKKSGLVRKKQGFRYDKAMTYMYRIRFNTILKLNNDVNSNIAEKLMAHKKGLDGTYLQPTREECFNEFVKTIPELTIDPTERQKLEIKKQKLETTENQKIINELKEKTTSKISNMEQQIKELQERNDREVEEKNIMAENYRNDTSIPATDDDLKELSITIPQLKKLINDEIIKNKQKVFEISN